MTKQPASAHVALLLDVFAVSGEQSIDVGSLEPQHFAVITTALSNLEVRRREIIHRNYGLDENKLAGGDRFCTSLAALAREMNISSARVHQLKHKAIRVLFRDSTLYPVAKYLEQTGISSERLTFYLNHTVDPALVEGLKQQTTTALVHQQAGLVFVLDCYPECTPSAPCPSCRARQLLRRTGILDKILKLARELKGERSDVLSLPVSVLKLSVRSANALLYEGVETVGQLCQRTPAQLLRTPNFGRKSLIEVKERLALFGLSLNAR